MSEYRSLDCIGYPGYSIDIEGRLINAAGQFNTPQASGSKFGYVLIRDGAKKFIPVAKLVAEAWKNEDPELWKNSPFFKNIYDCRDFYLLGPNEKKIIPNNENPTRYYVTTRGDVWDSHTFTRFETAISRFGYIVVKTGYFKGTALHILLARAFVPIPKDLLEQGHTFDTLVVRHVDGNLLNNSIDNLEWVTTDVVDRQEIGRQKVDQNTLERIWQLLSEGKSNSEISKMTAVNVGTVYSIRKQLSRRYVTDAYTWPGKPEHARFVEKEDGTVTPSAEELKIREERKEESIRAVKEREDSTQKILELFRNGVSPKDISKQLGINYSTVHYRIRKCNNGAVDVDAVYKDKSDKRKEKILKFVYEYMRTGNRNHAARIAGIPLGSAGHAIYEGIVLVPEFGKWVQEHRNRSSSYKQKLVDLLIQGKSTAEVDGELGVTTGAIHSVTNDLDADTKLQVDLATAKRVASLKDRAKQLHAEGVKPAVIARELNINLNTLWNLLRGDQ